MISKAAKSLAYFFAEKNIIKPEDVSVYEYGYEIMIAEAINWLITIIIALFTQKIIETIVYMLAFMRLRGALGGFHAKSHWGCIIISTVVYLLCLLIAVLTPLKIYWILITAGLILHTVLVLTIAPVAHPNKPFINEAERLKFRKKSIRLSVIYSVITIILTALPWEILKIYGYCIVLGMLSSSISMAIEYTTGQKNKNTLQEGGAGDEKS